MSAFQRVEPLKGFQREDPAARGYRAIAERHIYICRPVGRSTEEIDSLVDYAVSRVGGRYDLKNIFDLKRSLIQRLSVPGHWIRRLLSIGSGDPTRAICSSLIAEAFHSVSYPILPEFVRYE